MESDQKQAERRKEPVRAKQLPDLTPREVLLDAEALNARLLGGHQLAISESGGEVVRCTVVLLNELVPPDLFDSYLARGLIQERPSGQQFGISADGRKRLR
jgi:hypothetical protein